MPTHADAFHVAYGLNMVGAYFDGASMLAHVGGRASDALKALCKEQIEGLANMSAPTRSQVRRINRALKEAGLEPPAQPHNPDEYEGWVEAVSGLYYDKLGDEDGTMSSYLVGWYLGQWIEQANLSVIALVLKEEDAEYAPTLEHLATLGAGLAEAREGLIGAFAGWALADKATDAIEKATKYVTEAPALDDPEQDVLDVADDYQEALHELTAVVESLDQALS